jgi:hypothetical protein
MNTQRFLSAAVDAAGGALMSGLALHRSKEVTFLDDDGMRWTVVPVPAGRVLGAGPAGWEFVSEAGERRVASGRVPDGVAWQAVDEQAWRAVLRHALLVT